MPPGLAAAAAAVPVIFGGPLGFAAPFFLLFGYVLARWEQSRPGAAEDTQVGLKLVLYFALILALGIGAQGISSLLHYLLSLTKAGHDQLKTGIAALFTGGAVIFGVQNVLLPRTNYATFPRVMRLATGVVCAIAGANAIVSFTQFLVSLIRNSGWAASTSPSLADALVYGALAFFSLMRFGSLSGWTIPPRAPKPVAAPPAQQPPPGYQGGPQGPGAPPGGVPGPVGGGGFPPGGAPGGGPAGGPGGAPGGGYSGGGGLPPPGGHGGAPPQGGGFPPK